MKDLQQKINVVLNEEKRAYRANDRKRGGLGSFNVRITNQTWSREGEIPSLLRVPASLDAIQSPNAEILLKLYSSSNSTDKQRFAEILLSYLSKQGEVSEYILGKTSYPDVAYLIFFVLHRIDRTIDAIEQARSNLKSDGVHGFSNMLAMLSQIVANEYSYIGSNLFQQIKEEMQNEDEHNFQLFEKINSAEFELLKKELSDINPEINRDREKILNLWSTKFNSPEIPSLIDEIEQYFSSGDFTPTKFATCIDRVRMLLVSVLREIAIQAARKNKDSGINKNAKEHKIFDYLKSQKLTSEKEYQLIKALYGLASEKGAHCVIAQKEYARLLKNMTYELILLALSKYEQGVEN